MRINPTITLSFRKPKQVDAALAQEEPTPNYVEDAEKAFTRLGTRLILGACVVVATYVVLTVAGTILINTLDTPSTE